MEEREFRTPHGATVRLLCRPGTNDQMMAQSCLDEDEYGLADVPVGSVSLAADIGSHIGMVAIGLAVDHPTANILAVEPLDENLHLIEENARLNGVLDRITIIPGAAAKTKAKGVRIAWDFEGHEQAAMHRFVANQPMPDGTRQKFATVEAITLADLIPAGTLDMLVTDCEGGEYELLGNASAAGKNALRRVAEIRGEYHGGYTRLVELLDATHVVERVGGDANVGGFIARLRA